ncbi:YceI family protein [Luteimonas aestuarii]|nr:YceI family protein [Luteimonas aestuarii]
MRRVRPARAPSRVSATVFALALACATAVAQAAPVEYRIDPGHTDVIAQWNHLGFSNPTAHFGQVDGTIVYDADKVAASSVQVTLPLSGLNSHVARFDAHLRNADFFDADVFPVATFRSTAVEDLGEDRLKVTGALTIKDITRTVVLDAVLDKAAPHPRNNRPTIGFDATANLLRSDFGLGLGAPAVSDEVQLRITTEAQAAAAD